VLEIHGDSLEGRFLDDLGTVRDSFAIVKSERRDRRTRGAPGLKLALASANPARAGATFAVDLPGGASARLSIVDAAGRLVHRLPLGESPSQQVVWASRGVPAGVYFAVLESGSTRRVARIVLLP
jgi:hypothetical protein